ncbi:hypothetical protein CHR53_03410 [Neobacillus mesonae]|uniref:Wall-associated protein n=1 Tax=Neobacillus mesonae TaxID=1193713 RepID=A0A3Q9QZ25_9BACI|nr:hypothetical protein CHR53_03410 [Neobacillus mesonae]
MTDPNGNNVWKTYDSIGNVTGETVGGDTRQYEYDANDYLTKVIDENGRTTDQNYFSYSGECKDNPISK